MRFKTEKEFLMEFGTDWRKKGVEWTRTMDALFGKEITPGTEEYAKLMNVLLGHILCASISTSTGYWTVEAWMLTEAEMDDTAKIERIRKALVNLAQQCNYTMEDIAFAALFEIQKGE